MKWTIVHERIPRPIPNQSTERDNADREDGDYGHDESSEEAFQSL